MKLIELYGWIAGSMSDFTKPFQENDTLFNQAKGFWKHLDGSSIFIIVIFLILGIAFSAYYYKPYNDSPGRHYKPSHWLVFLGITLVLTFVFTFVFEYIVVKPVLKGAGMLEMRIALGNAVYAAIVYFITSVVWCYALPTNAYRYFKI